jgi:hypothetical protein
MLGSCSSSPPANKPKTNGGEPNKEHWDGTTGVLRNYRLPDRSKPEGGTGGVAHPRKEVGKK